MTEKYLLLYCTTPDNQTAVKIAQSLVQDKLAACCNVIEGVQSIYVWNDELEQDSECLMIIKSVKSKFDKLKERIVSMHPYDVPEIIATDITAGYAPYLQWLRESTGK